MGESICQSCGMPMSWEEFGTNSSGVKTTEYCRHCFRNGRFIDRGITMEGKIRKNIEIAVKMGMPEDKARALAEKTIPKLKRWKKEP